ncbi:MAG: OBG GTPase family GTP-binding protein [Halobacteria archaeon]
MGLKDDIREIEEEISETPYNKSTEKHIGRLKAKLSKLRDQLQKRQSGGGGGGGYDVPKTGDATVAFVGFPSVGKSTLLNALTNAESEIGDYGFTTLNVVPGMLKYEKTEIQVLDVPGMIEGASGGRGGGREVMSVLRSADLLLFVVDVFQPDQYEMLREELYENGIRMDTTPPNVRVTKKDRGGIKIRKSPDVELSDDLIREACRQHGYVNAHVVVREDLGIDRLNDALLDNRVYIDSMVCVNKVDLADSMVVQKTKEELSEMGVDQAVGVSAEKEMGLGSLKQSILEELNLKRIYLKPQRGDPDYEDPVVMESEATVGDVARKIHRDFEGKFRFAKVWGDSVKHDGQQIGEEHRLEDEDVLTLIMDR